MIGAIVHQLTRSLSDEEIKKSGFDTYFVDHTAGVYPASAAGVPYTAAYMQSKGDMITDLHEDLAAEQKARTTYDNILRLVDDPDVRDPIKFLREREIVHYQRFGEPNRTKGKRVKNGVRATNKFHPDKKPTVQLRWLFPYQRMGMYSPWPLKFSRALNWL